jgi:hypothetical protein
VETADHAGCGGGRIWFGVFAACAEVVRRHPERQILAAVAGVGGASLSQANRQRFSTIDSEDLSVEGISPFLQSCFLEVRVMGFLQNRRFHLEINLFFY